MGCNNARSVALHFNHVACSLQLAPKRLHLWCCILLLCFLGLARFEILQDLLFVVVHVLVGSFALISLLYQGCTEVQILFRFL